MYVCIYVYMYIYIYISQKVDNLATLGDVGGEAMGKEWEGRAGVEQENPINRASVYLLSLSVVGLGFRF